MSMSIWLAVPLLVFAPQSSLGEAPARPACTAQIQGMLWPEKHPVQICSSKRFHYEWKQLTIDVSQLKAGAKPKQDAASLPPDPPPHD